VTNAEGIDTAMIGDARDCVLNLHHTMVDLFRSRTKETGLLRKVL
jgi:hypothetical protein